MKYTTKTMLASSHTIPGIDAYTPGDPSTKKLLIKMTSGTTGTPTIVVMKRSSQSMSKYSEGQAPSLLHIKAHQSMGMWMSLGVFENTLGEHANILYIGKRELTLPNIEKLIAEFEPTVIHATPGLLEILFQTIHLARTKAFLTVKKILLSGARSSSSLLSKLQKEHSHIQIIHNYSLSEFGTVAVGCQKLTQEMEYEKTANAKVHPSDEFSIEILNPDHSGIGEISIGYVDSPERYQTGDMGKLEHRPCSCGKNTVLTVYGRYNFDVVHCVGATIYAKHLEAIFDTLTDYVIDFSVEIKEVCGAIDTVGEITFVVVPTKKLRTMDNPETFIGETVAAKLFVTKTRTLLQLVHDGVFKRPNVRFVDSFPTQDKTVRIRHVE